MQIRIENFERCYPKRLKRLFQSNINLKTYSQFVPQMERAIVGNIPVEIIKMFPKEVRGEKVKEFQKILAQIACQLREEFSRTSKLDNFTYFDENYRPSKYVKNVAKTGEEIFNKILEETFGSEIFNAKLSFAGNGTYGIVYRLSLFDKNGKTIMHDKALKVFHNVGQEYSHSHNIYAEANFWTFLKHAAGHKLDKTQFTKHYISDLHSGYALTEFIDGNIAPTTKKLPIFELFSLTPPKDSICNMPIMGKICDIGGILKKGNFTADKIILRYTKQLFYAKKKEVKNILDKLKQIAQNPKTPHRNKIQEVIERFS